MRPSSAINEQLAYRRLPAHIPQFIRPKLGQPPGMRFAIHDLSMTSGDFERQRARSVIVFLSIGGFVNRAWMAVLIGWVVLGATLHFTAPAWSRVAQDGEFSFLPYDAPSRRAERLFDQAFPQDLLSSSIVVVVSRDDDQGLQDGDKLFITDVLRPRLQKITSGEKTAGGEANAEPPEQAAGPAAER